MILFRRFLPTLTVVVLWALFQVGFASPQLYITLTVVAALVASAATIMIHPRPWRESGLFAVAPALFQIGLALLLVYPERALVRQLIAAAAAVGLWIYLEQLFAFRYRTQSFQPFALESIASYLDLASVFMITLGLIGLRYALGLPMAIAAVAIAAVQLAAAWHALAMAKIEAEPRLAAAGVIALCGTEFLAALVLLPVGEAVIALLVTTFHFVARSLARYALRNAFDRQHLKRYIAFALGVVVLTILTSSWR